MGYCDSDKIVNDTFYQIFNRFTLKVVYLFSRDDLIYLNKSRPYGDEVSVF